MKHTQPGAFLTRELLRVVRDERPTVEVFVARFGDQCYHILRKHGLIVPDGEGVRLNRCHLSPDGSRFVWGVKIIHLDKDEIEMVRWGPTGPPTYSEHP
jgi:hypothetical protein